MSLKIHQDLCPIVVNVTVFMDIVKLGSEMKPVQVIYRSITTPSRTRRITSEPFA